ncbi:MAG: GNAT family N-acetyltransferase [Pseudomonadota bacterium]
MAEVARLFRAYEAWLQVPLCLEGFEAEVASLPGFYIAPAGGLWLARVEGRACGVVGLRPLEIAGACEMKRLWVEPSAQGLGLGRRLAETALAGAKERGYSRLLIDTLPKLETALALYRALGFRPRNRYNDNALPGVLFFEKDMTP